MWHGKPKNISTEKPIDVIVTMGCDVACPTVPNAKIIRWDIPDPKGKGSEEYRRTVNIIKEKIIGLLKEETS